MRAAIELQESAECTQASADHEPHVKISFEEGARPIHILRRLVEHADREVLSVPLWAVAGFTTTKSRASATLKTLHAQGFVVFDGEGWSLTEGGRTEYTRLTREKEANAAERRKLTCSGWTQQTLF